MIDGGYLKNVAAISRGLENNFSFPTSNLNYDWSLIKRTAHIFLGRRTPSKLSDNVLESIELFKLMKPSMSGREIRERLLTTMACAMGETYQLYRL